MRTSDRLPTLPRRLLGLGMIGVVLAILGLCVAVYNKVFAERVPVTVRIDQVDNSFLPNAEVRMYGVNVGTVDSADVQGDTAVLHLALDPEKADVIPRNVRAMILPKSLFGESFVSLEVPAEPAQQSIMAGDVIPRDRSSRAVQVEQLFSNLLPLIEAVKPADLATTLGALNQGLTGRGEQLGDTIRQLHQYLVRLNQTLPDLTADIRAVPPFTETQSQAAPDLIQALRNLNTTSDTLVERRNDVATLFDTATDAADDLTGFFDENGDNIVDLADTARPGLDLLARYSPQNVCFFRRLADGVRRAGPVFAGEPGRPALRIRLVLTQNRGPFRPHQDEPDFTDDRGPRCYDNTPPLEQYPGGPAQDGSTHPPAREPGSLSSSEPRGRSSATSGPALPLLGGTGANTPPLGPELLRRPEGGTR